MARPLSSYDEYTLRLFSVENIESKLLLLEQSARFPPLVAIASSLSLVGFDLIGRIRREIHRGGSYARPYFMEVAGAERLPVVVLITRKK